MPLRVRKVGFEPARAGELDDLALLPRRFEFFVSETRETLQMLSSKVLASLARIEHTLTSHGERLRALELWRESIEKPATPSTPLPRKRAKRPTPTKEPRHA